MAIWREQLMEAYVARLVEQARTTTDAENLAAAARADEVWRTMTEEEQVEAERRYLQLCAQGVV